MNWLEKKYLSMVTPLLDMAKWKGDNTLNHRCPYCGDSSKNKIKARGYHFLADGSYVYKCHNCGKSTSSVQFLKDNFPNVHRDYKKEWLKENGRQPRKTKMPSANAFKFKSVKITNNRSILDEISVCAWDHPDSKSYLTKRKVPVETKLRFVESAQSLTDLSPKYKDRIFGNDPRIVIPFYDDNELVGVSGRAINNSQLRYLTVRLNEDSPLIYNLNNVDVTKRIYVTEGPIDSFFLKNSVAVGGSDFKKIPPILKTNAVLVYDNEPRNHVILAKIEEVIAMGFSVCIWNNRMVREYKDINEMILSGLSSIDVMNIIDSCTYSGLSAKAKLMEYKKV